MTNFTTPQGTSASPLELQGSESADGMLAAYGWIRSRRSIRQFRPDPVPLSLVGDLLALAGQAPSAHNRQPWRWVVVHSAAARQRLADEMGRDFERDLRRDGLPDEQIAAMVARSYQRIAGAPVVLVPCLTMAEMDRYPDPQRQHCEWQMAVQSVALACGTFMLAAHAAGLGSCFICAPIFCIPTVQRTLDLAGDWEPQGLITLGWPADGGRQRERKPVEAIALYR